MRGTITYTLSSGTLLIIEAVLVIFSEIESMLLSKCVYVISLFIITCH
jgi:hypothetical protein